MAPKPNAMADQVVKYQGNIYITVWLPLPCR